MDFSELETTIKHICAEIPKGDVIAVYSENTPIEFEMDRLKTIEDISRFSVGLRVFNNGRAGNSYINSLQDKDIIVKNALESSSLGDEIDIDLPPDTRPPLLKTYYPEIRNYQKEKGISTGNDIIKRLKEIDKEAKISVSVSTSYSRNYLANTSGFWGLHEESYFGISANMLRVEEGGGLLSVGDGDAAYSMDVDIDAICSNIEWRYKNALTKVGMSTGYYPVIFTPEALGLLLEGIEIAANAKTLYKGISVLSGKEGQNIADPAFTLLDNPLLENGIGSYPFDDEGVIPGALPIIENGVFKNFIFDLTTARRLNKKSTGHGSRNTSSMPSPSFSNLMISGGKTDLEEMIKSVKYGLIVYEFLGGGMSNILAGDFSVNVELGYLIENGKIKGRVKDTMLSGNIYDLLTSIGSIETKVHKKGSLYAPHILFDKVSISG